MTDQDAREPRPDDADYEAPQLEDVPVTGGVSETAPGIAVSGPPPTASG